MPSNRFASEIERSLAPNERFADFAYLFDALLMLRRPYHQDTPQSETITGKLLCVVFPDKPAKYIAAMREFRLRFTDVASNPELQAEFSNCVKHAALTVSRPEAVAWRPDLYFSIRLPRLRDIKEWF
jgi:hypothetical protein